MLFYITKVRGDVVRTFWMRRLLVFRNYLQGNQFSSLTKGRKRVRGYEGKGGKNGAFTGVT